ncbi:unnamed protein product [Prorocentrum cordatum]|uniref:Uncharacterized protein n=1 Tax=Prorocentrum cordatum TaxID=2364126 RepID=A0ABN9UHA8_9DINO|nr:unnamed protein product [Polarella glacialis]
MTPWEEWPKKEAAPADVILELSVPKPAAKHVSQAKEKGGAVILWHCRGPCESSADASQLQARRRRLTDAMLRDVASRTGEKVQVVQWWFRIFEFYCARPADRWPSLADLPVQESGPESASDRLQRRRRSTSPSRRHLAACGGRSSDLAARRSPSLGAVPPESAADRLRRVALRQIDKGPPQAQRKPEEWTQSRWDEEKDLYMDEVRGICQDKGLLDLISRAKTEDLDAEKLKEWLSHYTVHKLLEAGMNPMIAVFSLASEGGGRVDEEQIRQEMARRTQAIQVRMEQRQSERDEAVDPKDFEAFKSVFSTRFAKAKEETGKKNELFARVSRSRSCTPKWLERTPSELSSAESLAGDGVTGEQLMLHASSYALLSCGLLNKAPEAREHIDQQEQVRRAGARILRETVPGHAGYGLGQLGPPHVHVRGLQCEGCGDDVRAAAARRRTSAAGASAGGPPGGHAAQAGAPVREFLLAGARAVRRRRRAGQQGRRQGAQGPPARRGAGPGLGGGVGGVLPAEAPRLLRADGPQGGPAGGGVRGGVGRRPRGVRPGAAAGRGRRAPDDVDVRRWARRGQRGGGSGATVGVILSGEDASVPDGPLISAIGAL